VQGKNRPQRVQPLLAGDHLPQAVEMELACYHRRLAGPALFILDDRDEHFPGIETAIQSTGQGMARVLHLLLRLSELRHRRPLSLGAWKRQVTGWSLTSLNDCERWTKSILRVTR
jgi:hypothetical protein